MFVIDHARGLIQDFPAALPGQIAEVGVFQIERREQFVEAAELQKLSAVKGAGSAAAVGARIQLADLSARSRWRTRRLRRSPPAFREPGFLAKLVGIGKEDLAGDGEHLLVGEAVEQGLEEIRLHAHVAIEQHHDVMRAARNPAFEPPPNPRFFSSARSANLRETFADERRAAVLGAVIDHDDFASGNAVPRRRSPKADISRADRAHSSWE